LQGESYAECSQAGSNGGSGGSSRSFDGSYFHQQTPPESSMQVASPVTFPVETIPSSHSLNGTPAEFNSTPQDQFDKASGEEDSNEGQGGGVKLGESSTVHTFKGTDPADVAEYLDQILSTLAFDWTPKESLGSAADIYTMSNKGSFSQVEGFVKNQKRRPINNSGIKKADLGRVLDDECMNILLGAMNYAYSGPHQSTHGLSLISPNKPLHFWTTVEYNFLEAMVQLNPEFFASIPWKEYTRNPTYSEGTFKNEYMIRKED
jgi:hypothetical protein